MGKKANPAREGLGSSRLLSKLPHRRMKEGGGDTINCRVGDSGTTT